MQVSLRLLPLTLLLIPAPPASAQREAHRSAYDDIRGHGRRITNESADWVIAQHSEDWARGWTVERSLRGGIEARGYPSPDRRFCLFVYARYGEYGQYRGATYCLVNDEGRALWADTSTVMAPPVVSVSGAAAAFENNGTWGTAICVLRDSTGTDLWRRTWANLKRRPLQRGWPEVYEFSPDGHVFVTTMNVCEYELVIDDEKPRTDEINETTLTIVDVRSGDAIDVDLGWFRPASIEFGSDATVTIEGTWDPVFSIGVALYSGSVTLGVDGTVIRKTRTCHPFEQVR